ncbi:MAG: hypothetical protein AB1679_00505 [Actinomycetota bacterium]
MKHPASVQLRGVQITGRAELVWDTERVAEIGRQVIAHAGGGELALAAVPAMAPKRVAIIVKRERVASWDHAKLDGVY